MSVYTSGELSARSRFSVSGSLPSLGTSSLVEKTRLRKSDFEKEYYERVPVTRRGLMSIWTAGEEATGTCGSSISDDGGSSTIVSRASLRTPPEIRQKIRLIQQAKREREQAEEAARKTFDGGDVFFATNVNVPSSASQKQPHHHGGPMLIRARTGTAANMTPGTQKRRNEEKQAAEDAKYAFHKPHHHHNKFFLDSDEDKANRRAAVDDRKRERAELDLVVKKKPSSPPKTPNAVPHFAKNSRGASSGGLGDVRELSDKELMNQNDLALHENYSKYFGPGSLVAFHEKFRMAKKALEKMPTDDMVPDELRTPRNMYLRETSKEKLLPLPLVLRKARHPRGVFLAGKGLGDTRMLPVVNIIDTLPAIETIDLSDNRLTDISLIPLTAKLQNLSSLMHLDLSFNKMDESSETILHYIQSDICKLKVLVLNGADVDDYECCNLCDAIIHNKTIHTLGLARNLIGNHENRKLNNPDLVLGGDGIEKLLRENSTITSLDLTYNQLRQSGAVSVGKALRKNTSLKSISLSFNSFGDLGAQFVGHSLKYNSTLKYIDLTSNSIVPRSACVLANALCHNETVEHLILNDNVLGRIGAQAVVAAIQRCCDDNKSHTDQLPRRLSVGFSSCDCFKEIPGLFDPARPAGRWEVDLAEPYGQMVVEELIFLANFRAGCTVNKVTHNGNEIKFDRLNLGPKSFNVKAFHKNSKRAAKAIVGGKFAEASEALKDVLAEFRFVMKPEQRLDVVKMVKENWAHKQKDKERSIDLHEVFLVEVFYALFVINDEDLSGSMDVDELLQTLESLGHYNVTRAMAHAYMATHDRDNSGSIDASEFAMIMVNEFCRTDLPRGELVDKRTGKPWKVPGDGIAVVDVKFEIDAPSVFDVGTDDGIDTLIHGMVSAKTTDQKDMLFEQACTSPYFFLTSDQAQILFDEALNIGLSKLPLDMIICILPQIVNDEHVNTFLDANLNEEGKLALRVKMGPLYNAFIGLPTGHYVINFAETLDTMGSKRLAALSVSEAKVCRAVGTDVSQKGNGTNFRNEMFGNTIAKLDPIIVSGQWFASHPTSGSLIFDYISTKRPLIGTLPLSEKRLRILTRTLGLARIKELLPNAKLMEEAQERYVAAVEAFTAYKATKKKSKLQLEKPPLEVAMDNAAQAVLDCRDPELEITSPLSIAYVKAQFYEYVSSCHHHLDILPREIMRDVSRMNYNPDPDFRPPTPEVLRLPCEAPDKRNMPVIYPFAYRKLLELQVLMPSTYLTVDQLVYLLMFFPDGPGYLRVQLILSVFSHLLDVENFCDIMDSHSIITEDEKLELIHRLGMLNLFDPLRPDRLYKLDLRRWDQREMCKILVSLGVNEPGDNWVGGGEYRWGRYDDPVPGWELPAPWTTPDDNDGGPRHYGWLRVTYTSTAEGCEPNMALRRNLRKRTLSSLKRLL